MSVHTIDVQVEDPYSSEVKPGLLHQAAEATLRHQQVEEACELVLVVTGDETVRQLNERYRGVDAPTDVLAFPHQSKSPAPPAATFVSAPGFPRYLGDVLISCPRAKAQATEAGHQLAVELQLLTVHGVLHLLGWEDETDPERTRMWHAQKAILDSMGLDTHVPD